ncbi:hypothetical protein [Cellulosimicrobium funkei]|uniref:hypothetical protein n=1 Tax=Cellulosimicrobium funkei TaxID=264251 RepID=UPI00341E6AF1
MCQHHDNDAQQHDEHGTNDGHQHHGTHAHPAPATPDGSLQDDLAECPVMPGSMTIKADAEAAGLIRDHEGQRYWLCCSSCGPLFDADPARYARTA